MNPVKICIVTGSRAEFGLLTPLLNILKEDKAFNIQLLVTGMHLAPEFGNTYKNIEEAGFRIDEKVEMLLSADTATATVKSTGLGMIGYADALDRLNPDWILVLGDRFETFAAAVSAYLKKIPIIHLHGGEVTAGATDEGLRHSITKFASLHFTATEEYRKRVLQLGERDDMAFNVGAIGLDNVYELPLLEKGQLEQTLNLNLVKPFILVTYHPETLSDQSCEHQIRELFDALDEVPEVQVIFTMPNADASGRTIIQLIKEYVAQNKDRANAFTSLGQLRYLSLMKYAVAVLGNSSSGVIEAPGLGIPTVNIGDRQKGRVAAESVIHCDSNRNSIVTALKKALGNEFQQMCKTVENPSGGGGTSKKIVAKLKELIPSASLKKEFIDRL
jgi:GDP/UDP-N,N'-diacetylbacillosamine 2-epimerase (hydrolysing)